MPQEVTVRTADLLEILRANRSRHRGTFLEAQKGFRARWIEELERSLADARHRVPVRAAISLTAPEDHTADYDREIRMLELHQADTVVIQAHLFDQIVMDSWGWSAAFTATNSAYLR